MNRARILRGPAHSVLRIQYYSSNKPPTKNFSQLWEYAKPKLEATQAEVSQNAERVLTSLKGSVLEMMARRMPKDSRTFLADRWGFLAGPDTVKDEKIESVDTAVATISTENRTNKTNTECPIPPNVTVDRVTELTTVASTIPIVEVVEEEIHPVLGKLICDLGYKKVYVTNIRGLVQAPVWERQRILRPHRSQKIATSKAKLGGSASGLPGVITLFMDKATKSVGIVDGQHRAGALMLLAQDGVWCDKQLNILIDVYETNGDKEISTLFTEINSAEPVRQIDMPDENVSSNVREILTEATDMLASRYKDMFKTSARCRIPHIHADSFRDELYQAEFVSRHKLKTTQDLLVKLDEINRRLGARSMSAWSTEDKPSRSFTTAYEKAQLHDFYLGLTKTWMTEE